MRSWSTASTPGGSNVDYWRQAICEAIFELDFRSSDGAIDACLNQHDLGILKLSDVAIGSAHQVVRSRQAAARDKQGLFNLNFVRSGQWLVNHYGREVEVRAGELVLVDNRQPYSVTAREGTTHFSVHIPGDWLRCWIPNPELAVATPVGPGSPWHSMLTSTLQEIMHIRPEDTAAGAICVQQIGGALSLSLGGIGAGQPVAGRGLHSRIIGMIRERFCEHDLDAAMVAAAVQISHRYLHKILAQEGTTFLRELFHIRLTQARAMLENPAFADVPVAEIGWRCGFCDPSHFSRRFKAHFGGSPGAFRALKGGCAATPILH